MIIFNASELTISGIVSLAAFVLNKYTLTLLSMYTKFKPEGYNTKNRKTNFQYGDFYDMINQIMMSYDALMDYWKKHKKLPSYTEVAKSVKEVDLTNMREYSKLKRLNQIEARCIEVAQIKDDRVANSMRGLQDRLARSTDSELQQLAKLF